MAFATCFATAAERHRELPVDGIVPDAIFTSTHAITIDAPPEAVWPWIAQRGAGRAGWYSWDLIDNGGSPSATRLIPELQTVVPGAIMPVIAFARLGHRIMEARHHTNGVFWLPMHQRAVLAAGGGTMTDTLHIVWAVVTSLLFMVALGFGATTRRSAIERRRAAIRSVMPSR